MQWHVGDTPKFQCYFYLNSVLTDPSTITLSLENPAGTITSYTYAGAQVTKNATGDFYKAVTLDTEGNWKWRWVSTGAVAAADEGDIEVKRSDFA